MVVHNEPQQRGKGSTMDYAYDTVTHQVGREEVDGDGNGEDKVIETLYSHALNNKLVIRVDKQGVFFTVINILNNKMLASARTMQYNIMKVRDDL
jgi:hypothetical protein